MRHGYIVRGLAHDGERHVAHLHPWGDIGDAQPWLVRVYKVCPHDQVADHGKRDCRPGGIKIKCSESPAGPISEHETVGRRGRHRINASKLQERAIIIGTDASLSDSLDSQGHVWSINDIDRISCRNISAGVHGIGRKGICSYGQCECCAPKNSIGGCRHKGYTVQRIVDTGYGHSIRGQAHNSEGGIAHLHSRDNISDV